LRIEDNILFCTRQAVALNGSGRMSIENPLWGAPRIHGELAASTGSVSIENNLLHNIVPRLDSDVMVIGVGVAGADGATIAGNTIRGLGVQAQRCRCEPLSSRSRDCATFQAPPRPQRIPLPGTSKVFARSRISANSFTATTSRLARIGRRASAA
jgi:hypothetical protein